MKKEKTMKAIIIGGGIGGLSTAIALKNAGIKVAIFERAAGLRTAGAGLSIWSNAAYALKKLGVLENVMNEGKTISKSAIVNELGQNISEIPLHKLNQQAGAPTIAILRKNLLQILYETLKETEIHFNAECIDILTDTDQVTAVIKDGRRISADLLIGADGIHSAVRNKVFGHFLLRNNNYLAWRGVTGFQHDYITQSFMFESWGKGNRFGFVPVNDKEVYWFATHNAVSHSKVGNKQEILSLFSHFASPIPDVIESTDQQNIIETNIYDLKPLRNWVKGRVALLGDAAHPMTPNLGQGACMAIEDGLVLAGCLIENGSIEKALINYEKKRIKRVRLIVNSSRQIGIIGQLQHPILCKSRNFFMKNTPKKRQNNFHSKTIGFKADL